MSQSCCVCDPVLCETDETGSHCAVTNCPPCLDGCPEGDESACCRLIPWLMRPEWLTPPEPEPHPDQIPLF